MMNKNRSLQINRRENIYIQKNHLPKNFFQEGNIFSASYSLPRRNLISRVSINFCPAATLSIVNINLPALISSSILSAARIIYSASLDRLPVADINRTMFLRQAKNISANQIIFDRVPRKFFPAAKSFQIRPNRISVARKLLTAITDFVLRIFVPSVNYFESAMIERVVDEGRAIIIWTFAATSVLPDSSSLRISVRIVRRNLERELNRRLNSAVGSFGAGKNIRRKNRRKHQPEKIFSQAYPSKIFFSLSKVANFVKNRPTPRAQTGCEKIFLCYDSVMSNKKILDIAMLMMFFVGLSSNFFHVEVHEAIGGIFFAATIFHNFTNKNFYKNFLRGNFTRRRIFNHVCIIFFGAGILLLILSGLAMGIFFGEKLFAEFNWRAIHLGAAIFSLVMLFVHLLIHARRYVRGKIFYAAAMISFLLAVGGIFGLPYVDRWFHKVEISREKILRGEKILTDKKFLTVYFSRVGNTNFPADVDAVSGASVMRDGAEIIGNAQMISLEVQSIVGGEIFGLQTEKIYPAKYSDTTKIAQEEFSEGELPPLKSLPAVENFDAIILVYPLWWGTLPKPVENFLLSRDLRGKILIPIVTHGGGGLGKSLDALKTSTAAKISEPLEIYSSDIPSARKKIYEFMRRLPVVQQKELP